MSLPPDGSTAVREPAEPPTTLGAEGRALLFTEAHTAYAFDPAPLSDAQLHEIAELARWPPTSGNINPLRLLFVRTEEAKRRLLPHLNAHNRRKSLSAPVVAILAVDVDFHELMPRLFPPNPSVRDTLAANRTERNRLAQFNGALQAGYFILAVRAAGFAAGPMGGFDHAGVDLEFFSGSAWRSILVVNIGLPGEGGWRERLPRLDHDQFVRYA